MRNKIVPVLAAAGLAIGLAGCGSGDLAVTETTIELKKDGSVVHTIVEEFTEDYYDVSRLQAMIQTSCDSYNAGKENGVGVEEITNEGGMMRVKMNYPDAAAYAGFNQSALFLGTVKEAHNAGYDLNVTLVSMEDNETTIGKEEILGMGEKHIAIVREAVDVRVWSRVLYASQDVLPTGDAKTVLVGDSDALTYLIFD